MADALEPAPEATPEPVVPAPDAVEVLPVSAAEPATALPAPLRLRQEKTYPRRFRIAIFALGILAGAAVVGFVYVATHHAKQPPPFALGAAPGSKAAQSVGPSGGWHPVCDIEFGCDRPHQIAAYVAPKYELSSGKDIVSIISGRPTVPQSDGTAADVPVIIERNDRGSRVVYTATTQDNTVQYDLCGFGASCTLGGTPSIERGDLLRRQALELALLTFKYDTLVKSVLTFFPKPAKATDPAYTLFFRRQDYGAQLDRPLADTLGKQVVLKPGDMGDALARKIGDITSPRVFRYEYRQTQQGFPILVLTPAAY